MSCFFCEGHQTILDSDFVGYNLVGDDQYCDDCYDEINLDELPEIPTIQKITRRPVTLSSDLFKSGLTNPTAPRENDLTDKDRDEMEKRFVNSATYLELK